MLGDLRDDLRHGHQRHLRVLRDDLGHRHHRDDLRRHLGLAHPDAGRDHLDADPVHLDAGPDVTGQGGPVAEAACCLGSDVARRVLPDAAFLNFHLH